MSKMDAASEPGQSQHARIYVNDRRVNVDGDQVTVGEAVRKAGYDPKTTHAFRLRDARDPKGEPVAMDKVLRLGEESIYLRCVPKASKEKDEPSVVPSLATTPDDDPRRGLGIDDLQPPTPTPAPDSAPEPPGPPPL